MDYFQVEVRRFDEPWSSAALVQVPYPSTSHTVMGLNKWRRLRRACRCAQLARTWLVFRYRVSGSRRLGRESGPWCPRHPRWPLRFPMVPGLYALNVSWAAPADPGCPLPPNYPAGVQAPGGVLAHDPGPISLTDLNTATTIAGLPPATPMSYESSR